MSFQEINQILEEIDNHAIFCSLIDFKTYQDCLSLSFHVSCKCGKTWFIPFYKLVESLPLDKNNFSKEVLLLNLPEVRKNMIKVIETRQAGKKLEKEMCKRRHPIFSLDLEEM